jgi:hypothetical protein
MPDGIAVSDVQPPEMRDAQRRDVEERGEGWRWPVPDRATLETGMYGSAAGLADADYAALASRGTPQPYKTFTTPVRLRRPAPPGVRRAAIFCTAGGIDVATVRALLEQQDPRAMLFSDPDWELHELPTGHWAMFTEPVKSAELLARIAAG